MNTEDGALYFKEGLDNKQFIAAIDESTRRIQGHSDATVAAGAKIDLSIQKSIIQSNQYSSTSQKNQKQELGRIEELRANIDKLTVARDKSHSIEKIEAYNLRIKQETEDLKELTRAGLESGDAIKKQGEATEGGIESIVKWVFEVGSATAILGTLKKALEETVGGLNLFNNIGAITKQVLYDIVSGGGPAAISIEKISAALAIQQELNRLRLEEYVDAVEIAQKNTEYQQLYSESLDATLSKEEKIKKIDEALKAHSEAIDLAQKDVRKFIEAQQDLLKIQPGNEDAIKKYSELIIKFQSLEAERYESTKRLVRQKSILEKEAVDEEIKWRKDLHDKLQKAADEQIENDNSIAHQQELLLEASTKGNEAEIKQIAERIKYLTDELNIRSEIAKTAILSANGGAVASVSTSNIKPSVSTSAWKPASLPSGLIAPSKTFLDKQADIVTTGQIIEQNEALEEQKKKRAEILQSVGQLTIELGRHVGLSEEAQAALGGAMSAIEQGLSGNWAGAAASLLTGLMNLIPDAMAKFQDRIDKINIALKEQQRLIDLAQRQGGAKEAMGGDIELKKQKLAADEAALAHAQLVLSQRKYWYNFGIGKNQAQKDVDALTQAIIDDKAAIEDADQALDDFLTGGVTQITIVDSLAQAFQDGKTSVDDFAEYTNQILMDAVMGIFKNEMLGPAITDLTKYISDALADKVLTPEEKAEIDRRMKVAADTNKQLWDSLTGTLGSDLTSSDKSLSGSIKGVTEETASVLAGQITGIRLSQAESTNIIREQLMHLSEIASNTRYLLSIDAKLAKMSSSSDLRSQGLVP